MTVPRTIKYRGRLYKQATPPTDIEKILDVCAKACMRQLGATVAHTASDDDREDLSVKFNGKTYSIVIKQKSS